MFCVGLQSNQKETIVSLVDVKTEGVAMISSDQPSTHDNIRVL